MQLQVLGGIECSVQPQRTTHTGTHNNTAPSEPRGNLACSAGPASGQPMPSVPEAEAQNCSALPAEALDPPIDLDMFEVDFLECSDGNTNATPIADYEPAVAEDAIDLETQEPPIDIEMLDVEFLETENSSFNRTGSGCGVGRHSVASFTNCEPAMAASISTMINLELSHVAAMISQCSDWFDVPVDVGAATSHLALVMLAVLTAWLAGGVREATGISVMKLTGTGQVGTHRMTQQMKSNEVWNYESIPGSHSRLLLSMCCMLAAAWCWYLPVWAQDWLGKLELETDRAKVLRRTWIRFCLCVLFPLIHIICAFHSYQDSGSIQTELFQHLGLVFIVVPLLRLQTDENALRIRRTALLIYGMLRIGYNWGAFAEDILWSPDPPSTRYTSGFKTIAQWHLCSAVMYTSLIDHIQDSFFIGAVTVLAANTTGLSKVIGLMLTSTVALCGKLMWCRLQLENRRSIEAALPTSSNE